MEELPTNEVSNIEEPQTVGPKKAIESIKQAHDKLHDLAALIATIDDPDLKERTAAVVKEFEKKFEDLNRAAEVLQLSVEGAIDDIIYQKNNVP